MKQNYISIQWEQLTIANRFLFNKVFSKKNLCLKLIRLILPDLVIDDISTPETEKDQKESIDGKGIRFDVYAIDNHHRAYDIEMQVLNTLELQRRSRYYAGMIDQAELSQGKHYSSLVDSYVVFICPFDLFGKGYYQYTFRAFCVEERQIELHDGATRIFLNAKGTRGEISAGLRAFLQYIISGRVPVIANEENGIIKDPVPKEVLDFLQEVDREVRKARKNKQWRAEYMNAMLYLQDAEEQGKRIGEQRGIEIGEQRGIEIGEQRGIEIGEQRGIEIGKKRGREQERRKRRAVEKKLKETQQELARLKRAMEDKENN